MLNDTVPFLSIIENRVMIDPPKRPRKGEAQNTPKVVIQLGKLLSEEDTLSASYTARIFGTTARMLHFYEAMGLLDPAYIEGKRFYSANDRNRLDLILRARSLGFTIREIRSMVSEGRFDDGNLEQRLLPEEVLHKIIYLTEKQNRYVTAIDELRHIQDYQMRFGSQQESNPKQD